MQKELKTLEAATHFIDPKTCIDQQYIGHNVDLKRQYLVSEERCQIYEAQKCSGDP